MHELSIAYNLVEIASRSAQQNGVKQVTTVHLRLGALSGVVKDALLFGYDIATAGTVLEGSTLAIEEVPVVVHCPACGRDGTLADIRDFTCPHCGAPTYQIVQGKELRLTALEYDE